MFSLHNATIDSVRYLQGRIYPAICATCGKQEGLASGRKVELFRGRPLISAFFCAPLLLIPNLLQRTLGGEGLES